MSNSAEENSQGLDSEQSNTSGGHPAWQEVLDALPESLHPLITPKLEEWDKGVQNKLQEVRSQYDPYKNFIDNNVDPSLLEQSLYIANHLQSNPEDFIQKAIDNFGLDYVKAAAQQAVAQQVANNDDEDPFADYSSETNIDVMADPRVKAMNDALQEMQQKFDYQQQQALYERQQEEFDNYLDELEETHGEFDRVYVTALAANGINTVDAVKQYQQMVNQAAAKIAHPEQFNAQQTQQPKQQVPVVMGADGNVGSGMPSQPINFAKLKPNELNSMVVQAIQNMNKPS